MPELLTGIPNGPDDRHYCSYLLMVNSCKQCDCKIMWNWPQQSGL